MKSIRLSVLATIILFNFNLFGQSVSITPSTSLELIPVGRIGIGVPTAEANLHVARGTGELGTAAFAGTNQISHFNYSTTEDTYIRGGKQFSNVIINDLGSGKVSIGGAAKTNSNGYILEIHPKNDKHLALYSEDDGSFWEIHVNNGITNLGTMALYSAGTFVGSFSSTTGAYTSISDQKLKKNIRPLENSINKVLALKPAQYQFINSKVNNEYSIGFIAQDVEPIFPELVSKNTLPDGKDVYTMDYSGFGVIAIKAIQEQQTMIQDLQNENSHLKKILSDFENRLKNLENK